MCFVLQSTWRAYATTFIIYNTVWRMKRKSSVSKTLIPVRATSVDIATSQAQTTHCVRIPFNSLWCGRTKPFCMHPLSAFHCAGLIQQVCVQKLFEFNSGCTKSTELLMLVFSHMHSPRFDSVSRKLSSS